ncbi:MAG: 50S ribosomal protein L9 [delta proteobacterium MLS_D]|jgi:large subunit ribosomal protein L9|nr:MAG: 50S ribosomal protein L9 [delta proteobacterium MLS_D]
MKVILKDNVASLGKAGDVVNVSDGYARNYLIPRNFALEATEANVKKLQREKGVLAARAEKEKADASVLAERIGLMSVTVARKVGEQDKLFGSVTARDIEEALAAQDVQVDRKNILLDEPLKEIGEFPVKIKLHHGVFGELTVNVVPET